MMNVRRRWQNRMTQLLRTINITTLSFVVVAIMTVGIFCITRDSLSICLMLIIPILILSWITYWWVGALIGLTAAAVTMPQIGVGVFFLTHPLDFSIWIYVSICYISLGTLAGLYGATNRKQGRFYADIEAKLRRAQASTKQYETLLEEMRSGQELLNRMNSELALLSTIATAVNSSLDLNQIQEKAMAHIGVLLDVDEVQIYGLERDNDQFILQCCRPAKKTLEKTPPVNVHQGILGQVLQYQHVVSIDEDAGMNEMRPPAMGADLQRIIAIPLRSRSVMIGVLVLGRKGGAYFSDDDGKFLESVGRVLAVAIDNARLFQQVQELSLSDELTGCANRRLLNLRLAAEVARVIVSGDPLSLVIMDLDHFKLVNDRYGHLAGDEVLRQFAQRVHQEIRSSDVFCRLGGEEFALVTVNTPVVMTQSIAERICWRIAATPFIMADGAHISVTVSGGVACLQPNIDTAEQLVDAADHALYAAKTAGRNRILSYTPDMAILPIHLPDFSDQITDPLATV